MMIKLNTSACEQCQSVKCLSWLVSGPVITWFTLALSTTTQQQEHNSRPKLFNFIIIYYCPLSDGTHFFWFVWQDNAVRTHFFVGWFEDYNYKLNHWGCNISSGSTITKLNWQMSLKSVLKVRAFSASGFVDKLPATVGCLVRCLECKA